MASFKKGEFNNKKATDEMVAKLTKTFGESNKNSTITFFKNEVIPENKRTSFYNVVMQVKFATKGNILPIVLSFNITLASFAYENPKVVPKYYLVFNCNGHINIEDYKVFIDSLETDTKLSIKMDKHDNPYIYFVIEGSTFVDVYDKAIQFTNILNGEFMPTLPSIPSYAEQVENIKTAEATKKANLAIVNFPALEPKTSAKSPIVGKSNFAGAVSNDIPSEINNSTSTADKSTIPIVSPKAEAVLNDTSGTIDDLSLQFKIKIEAQNKSISLLQAEKATINDEIADMEAKIAENKARLISITEIEKAMTRNNASMEAYINVNASN